MKNIHLLFLLALTSLASCKKDRYCSCNSEQMPQLEILPQNFHDTKKNAEKKCADREKELEANYNGIKCVLK